MRILSGMTTGNPLIFGHSDRQGLVAAEHVRADGAADRMVLFVRDNEGVRQEQEDFEPFLWLRSPVLLEDFEGAVRCEELAGEATLQTLAFFPHWKDLEKALKCLKKSTGKNPSAPNAPYFFLNDPVQQYLLLTGRTFFKGMAFHEVHRMQVDIETYTESGFEFSNPDRDQDRIIAIAMSDQTGWTEVLSGVDLDEKSLLEKFVATVQQRNPDTLEGHNFFKFDLPYLMTRARKCRINLALGRDGSVPRVRAGRFVVADRSVTYPKAEIFGRHIVDTYFQVQLYDVTHRSLNRFGLKDVARHFGITAPDRTYVPGQQIARVFEKTPEKIMAYARDDILETRALSDLLSPVYFTQAQILPFSYQHILVRGNAAKIDALMLRAYLKERRAVPQPDEPREFAGGYTDIFFEGVAENVHHCDIRSLYPSLMLQQQIAPATDTMGVFLKMLEYLRAFRIDAKQQLKKTRGTEQRYLDALQSTYKVLINSFYGYLGFRQARFSDFSAAAKVAAEGRSLLKKMIEWIRTQGGQPIEIDTDGIYFVPPAFAGDPSIAQFRQAFREWLPDGIEIEFDGEYPAMFSYKMKNYALLCDNDEVIIKGAALKSRGLAPFQRRLLRDIVRLKLTQQEDRLDDLKKQYEQDLLQGRWTVDMLAKTERLQDAPATYAAKVNARGRGKNAAYELALASDRQYQAGDQVSYYVTGNKKSVAVHTHARLASDWDPDNRDENVPYYLTKIEDTFKKFK